MEKTCKITRNTDAMFPVGRDFNSFPLYLDTPLPKETRATIGILGGVGIVTSALHESEKQIDGSYVHYVHSCKLLTNDCLKSISPDLLVRGVEITYFEDEILDSITHTRKMSVEDIIKEYGDVMSEGELEALRNAHPAVRNVMGKVFEKYFENKKFTTNSSTDLSFLSNPAIGGYVQIELKDGSDLPHTPRRSKLISEVLPSADKVVHQPWGSYTPTKDGFFIPPDRKPYNPNCVQFSGHISNFVNLRKDDTLYSILMNERENFLTSNSPFPIDTIQARIEEIENKTVYQDKDRDSFVKCGMALDLFMSGHKGFIAGGCFKNIFLGQKIKDVDIFFENMEDWSQAFNYYSKNNDFKFVYQNANAFCFRYIKTGQKVEIIRSRFGKPEDLIREFDFTVAKFAYYKDTSNDITEYRFVYHPDFFEHLVMKKLVMDESCTFPVNTFERTYRYQKYGFSMCRETKQKLIKLLQGANVDDIGSSLYFGFD